MLISKTFVVSLALGSFVALAACGGGNGKESDMSSSHDLANAHDLSAIGQDLTAPLEDLSHDNDDLAHEPDAATEEATFSGKVKPLLTADKCLTCHMTAAWDGSQKLAAAKFIAYLKATKSSECPTLPFITAGNAADSYIYQKLAGAGSCFKPAQMPKGEAALTAAELAAVKSWIEAGALDN